MQRTAITGPLLNTGIFGFDGFDGDYAHNKALLFAAARPGRPTLRFGRPKACRYVSQNAHDYEVSMITEAEKIDD